MSEIWEAVIGSACVAGAYREDARTCRRAVVGERLRKADEWSARTTALLAKAVGAAEAGLLEQNRRPLPQPIRRRD